MHFKPLLLRIASALLTACMLLPLGRGAGETYDVRDPETCALHFSVLSDSHIEGNNYARYTVFARALQDLNRNRHGNDAVVFLGDNTMNGNLTESMLFHGAAARLLRDETILPVMGNHDIGNGHGDYTRLQKRWYDFTEAFFGRKLAQPYYYTVIDGFYFIVLGMEAQEVYKMQMTDAQFVWLEQTLEKASESGKPVFVFAHYPAYDAADEHGAYTDRLTDLLADYNREHDLFSFVGHTHMPLRRSRSFRTDSGYPEIYLPRLTELTGRNDNEPFEDTGMGVEVEVYGSSVVIRGRDFYRSEWKIDAGDGELCEKTFPLLHTSA